MLNKFFNMALGKAARMSGKPTRLLLLLSQMAKKVKAVNWKSIKAAEEKEKIFTLGRLIKAYALGEYRQVPWKTVLLIIAAIIYFINPIDLIPDLLPLTGFTDDFAILIWVYGSVNSEIEKFLTWERSQVHPT